MKSSVWAFVLVLLTGISVSPISENETVPPPTPTAAPENQSQSAPEEVVVHYRIGAELLTPERKLIASETLTWKNTSKQPVNELLFHLYPNAFRNEKSTFLTEAGFKSKSSEQLKAYHFGEIHLKAIVSRDQVDLMPQMSYFSPDDGNPEDRTVMRLKLPSQINPSQAVTLQIDFELDIPDIIARSGRAGDYYFFGQWFPKIGVLQSDGSWHCHQYHFSSEFFADYGTYDVELTLPNDFKVGASGIPVGQKKNPNGTTTHTFRGEKIHDFAWAASPDFKKITEKIELKGNPFQTEIVLLISPGHQGAVPRYLRALKYAMNYYAENVFPYPYPLLTVVDPPLKGMASSGMEYPTLITSAYISLLPNDWQYPEMTIIHEFGHQYWYGLLGNDEYRQAWLDEGIASFFDLEMAEQYEKEGLALAEFMPFRLTPLQYSRMQASRLLPLNKILTRSWEFLNLFYYTANVYSKASLFLRSLKNHIGQQKMIDFFKFYALKFRYRHPSTSDFTATFNEFFSEDFSWAFEPFLNGETNLDQAVYSLESHPVKSKPATFRNEATFVRLEGYFPVELLIKLQNGKEVKYLWKEKEKIKKITFLDSSPAVLASLDPEIKIPLDQNLLNNSRTSELQTSGLKRLSLLLGFWFQNLLSLISL